MPNIAKVIKEEIIRLAKKEAKIAIAGIRRDNIKLKKTADREEKKDLRWILRKSLACKWWAIQDLNL